MNFPRLQAENIPACCAPTWTTLATSCREIRKKLEASPHVFAFFLSPTGNGLKVVFRVPPMHQNTREVFAQWQKHVRDLTGIQIDENGKDLSRLCFMSYDPELYHNPDATELEPLPEPEKPKPAFNSSGEANLSERQRIAAELLGNIDWTIGDERLLSVSGRALAHRWRRRAGLQDRIGRARLLFIVSIIHAGASSRA